MSNTLQVIKETNNKEAKIIRYHIKLEETNKYYFAVDIESEKDLNKNNTKALSLAWNVIKNKLVNLKDISIGSGFSQEILKKEEL